MVGRLSRCRPLRFERSHLLTKEAAAAYLLAHAPDAPHLTSQPWIDYFLDRNWNSHPRLNWANLDRAKAGTYILWDKTSSMADHGIRYDSLAADGRFQYVAEFPPRGQSLRSLLDLFVKPARTPPKDRAAVVLFRKVRSNQDTARP